MRPVIITEKHILQRSLFTIAGGAITNVNIATAVADPAAASVTDVREGSKISAVYVEFWVQTDDAALGASVVTLEKLPSATPAMIAADSAALNSYPNKKNILYTQQGLSPNNVTYPMVVIKGWFKIPKGKQRFGLGDRLFLNILAQANGLNVCGVAVYKEQY